MEQNEQNKSEERVPERQTERQPAVGMATFYELKHRGEIGGHLVSSLIAFSNVKGYICRYDDQNGKSVPKVVECFFSVDGTSPGAEGSSTLTGNDAVAFDMFYRDYRNDVEIIHRYQLEAARKFMIKADGIHLPGRTR